MLLSDLNKIFDPLGFLAPSVSGREDIFATIEQMKIDWEKPSRYIFNKKMGMFLRGA